MKRSELNVQPAPSDPDAAEMPGFDAGFYRAIRPDLAGTDADLCRHYSGHGWRERSAPHPLFDPPYVKWQLGEAPTEGDEPFARYLAGMWRDVASPHPLFDAARYRVRYPDFEGDILQHYSERGWREGATPHPLFDPAFYRAQAGLGEDEDAFRHYQMAGWRAGLPPHPLFDPDFYREQRPDVAAQGLEPLAHYVQFGSIEGAMPHPLFDPAHYLRQVPDAALGLHISPLLDYLDRGGAAGLSPHPLFDVEYYRGQLGRAVTGPDLLDYLSHAGRETVSPSRLFDAAWYRDVALGGAMVPGLVHYLRAGWRGHDPHPCFDRIFYDAQAGAVNEPQLYHFRRAGEAAGLRPNALFSAAFYRAMHPGVVPDDGSAFEHYLSEGEAAGWAASPEFRPRRYASRYLAYAAPTSPMRHYMLAGRGQGLTLPQAPVNAVAEAFSALRADEAAVTCLVVLAGPIDAEARAAQLMQLAPIAEPAARTRLRRCVIGWMIELDGLSDLPPEAVCGKMAEVPAIVLAGAAFMPRADLARLAAATRSGQAAHPMVLDRALDIYHAGYDVVEGWAVPRGVGGDPDHPALRAACDRPTAGPVLAVPRAAMLAGGGPGWFWAQSARARFVPSAQACLLDAVVGGPPAHAVAAEGSTPVRPRLLLIDSIVPRVGFDAGSHYALQLMEMYQGFGYDVTLLPDAELAGPDDAVAAIASEGIELIQAPFAVSSAAFIGGVQDIFDVIVMSRYNCGGRHMEALRARWPGARLLFHPGDLHHVREIREAVLHEDVDGFARALQTKRRELEIVARADMTVVVSDHELAVLKAAGHGGNAVMVEPAFSNRTPAPYRAADRQGVAFIGGFGHQPNVDAVTFLCTDIWPRVTAARPDLTLHIVGSAAPAAFGAYASDTVRIRGRVEDLDGLLDELRMTVAPLRYGAGVKMKLVSSLAAGVPVVCTALAAEGLGLAPGQGLVLADDAAALAEAIMRLYDDAPRLEALSAAGRQAVHRRFAAPAVHAAYRAAVGAAMERVKR